MARSNKWRKGDKSEYLAQVFLSSFSFSNPTNRPEDYGIDFVCSIIEKDGHNLYPNETFNVQVKSGGNKKVEYTAKTDSREFNWLLKNQTPIIFTHVDLDNKKMLFYSYSKLNYFNIQQKQFNKNDKIVLKFDIKESVKGLPHKHSSFEYKSVKNEYHYHLGKPFMTLSMQDITDDIILEEKKLILKKVLKIERENILYKNLHLPLMRWFLEYETNEIDTFKFGWAHFCDDEWEKEINNPQNILNHIGQLIITLASSYKLNKDDQDNGDKYVKHHNALRAIIEDLPIEKFKLDDETYHYKTYLETLGYRDEKGEKLPNIK